MTIRALLRTVDGQAVFRHHANVLLVTTARVRERVVDVLTRYAPAPAHCLRHWPVEPPTDGSIIIPAVEDLLPDDQLSMLSWYDHSPRLPQVFAVSAIPLFQRVLRGTFVEDLYYRLNTVYLRLDSALTGAVRFDAV
ncbi:MAG TPA: hypothetical protein VEU08_04880 [Vicinamibacterales bacterium]|nr:hypothetical protein [Vicinamibacterales bacterium]